MIKRVFDFLFSLILLVVLCPVLFLTALAVRIKLGVPILLCQQRPGYKERLFYVYKFRSMTDARDDSGNLLPDEQRLTPFGEFLRRTSLDEIPQLINVLKGELSFVGPRPLLVEYLPLYDKEQGRRHDVKPGITGWAQVNGRNAISWEDKFRLDVWYVDHQTFWLDVKILWMTAVKALARDGISAEGHVTMPKFKGEKDNNNA